MFKRSLSWFIFLFTLLEFVAKTHLTTYDSTHGFINSNHDRYLAKEISSIHDELNSDIRSVMMNDKHTNPRVEVKFNPEVLDFKCRHLGVPHLEKVTLFNTDSNYSVDMTSISGSTVHFHSSFFENKRIPPLGNTTFNVVFLGREEGTVESNLFIHTTKGHFKYHVKGDSVFSPYRLRPIVGVKIPFNITFSPYIYLYNPHSYTIQIIEIYCSGGAFHLELPGGETEGPKDMWEVAPYETKAIIRVRFVGTAEMNHTSYVRIKVNKADTTETLVVPLEIEPNTNALLYNPQGYIDFGVGGSLEAPRAINLTLCNPFSRWIRIASVSSGSNLVHIELLGKLKIPPAQENQPQCVELAELNINWEKAHQLKRYSDRILVRYKNHKVVTEIPFYLTVVEGGLKFNTSQTWFHIGNKSDRTETHKIRALNAYVSPVKLLEVSLSEEAEQFLQITQFNEQILKANEERTIFVLKLKPGVTWAQLKLRTWFHVRTNITDINWPLISYDGRFDMQLSHGSKDNSLDLGMISVESRKDAYIMLENKNPIVIKIKQVQTSIPSGVVNIVGCGQEKVNMPLTQSIDRLEPCTEVRPNEYAIVKLSVRSGRLETQMWGDVSVYTQYEQISIPVHFRIAAGKLEIGPDRLVFDQCFPGKICSHPLRIHSTFDHPMVIESIISIPPDERISCHHSGHILGRAAKVVGTLYLNPQARCGQNCYLGLQDPEREGIWWQSLVLPDVTADIDLNLVNVLHHRYLNETASGRAWENLTIRMDTSEVKGHVFHTRVKMSWPTLLANHTYENKSTIVFPLTQVGNTSYVNVTIRNPSSYELLVQVILDSVYPRFNILWDGVPQRFVSEKETPRNKPHGFFIVDGFGIMPLRLEPNEHMTITIGFRALDSSSNVGHLILRNNLTILELVPLTGRGIQPNFKFGNRRPGNTQPLLFEFGEKHLKECETNTLANNKKSISLRRSFTAKNNGEIPIYINNYLINDMPCEGYGFKIIGCEPTVLLPNTTKKIDIEFSPDFTLGKVTRLLILDTSLSSPVNYTLSATVPSRYLSLCGDLLERPEWERPLYNICISLLLLSLIIIIVVALLDADRIIREAVLLIARQNNVQHTLDLRSIGAATRQELQTKPDAVDNHVKSPPENVLKDRDKSPALKTDCEKYSAVVPATGKSRKKHKKVCDIPDREMQKKMWMEAHRHKNDDHKETILKQSQDIDGGKKHSKSRNHIIKKQLESKSPTEILVPSEEETSSTTTENSHIMDDQNQEKKSTKKQHIAKPNSPNINISEKENMQPKTDLPEKVISKEKSIRYKSQDKTFDKNKVTRRDRRDRDKLPNQKKQTTTSPSITNQQQPYTQHVNGKSASSSPTPQSNIWNENRASFSDVVAQSLSYAPTSSNDSSSTASKSPTGPDLYMSSPQNKPPKSDATKLGPIGSRAIWSGMSNLNQEIQDPGDVTPFYSDMAMESSNWFLDVDVWNERSQNQPRNPWMGDTLTTNSFWDGSNEVYQRQTTARPSQSTTDNVTNATDSSAVNYATNYLWGSSVWEPWTPPVPRTPPGFAPQRATEDDLNRCNQRELQQPASQNINYNPFSFGSIWNQETQPHANPWQQ